MALRTSCRICPRSPSSCRSECDVLQLAPGLARLPAEVHEDFPYFFHRQDVVGQPGFDRRLRHAAVLGLIFRLHDDEAAAGVDRPQPLRAVAAGAGENDAGRPLPLVFGEVEKEAVDQLPGDDAGERRQAQPPGADGQAPVGGAEVDAVGLDRHAVFDGQHRQCRVFAQQRVHDALPFRVEVLEDDEGHPRRFRQVAQKALDGVQAAGRGADGDDEKFPLRRRGCYTFFGDRCR